jgi:DUF1680 family protein
MTLKHLTRRSFLHTSAATLIATGPLRSFGAPLPDPAPTSTPREPLRQFDYAQVQLTAGPFADHYNGLHAHYLALSNDRLLKVYRQRAGLPAPGADMGGWYDLDGFVPGHALGQYISGLARVGASTGDRACHKKVDALVQGFAATLGPDNQSILRPATNQWVCYILDKHFAGLIDAATLSHIPQATDLLNRVLAGARPILPAHGRDRIGKKNPPYDETYVMPENLFLAAALTNNPAFTELAHRYLLDRELFDPLARGADPFPGQHAYSHAIALSSAGQAYLTLGNSKYQLAMQNAFQLLTTTQQFASGGWGPNETFITPHRGELHASLATTVDHFETPCGSYAATKLARYLIRTTPAPSDTAHADNLERVLFNTILVARPPDSDGDYFYYTTYSAAARKVYYPSKWPCCSGTLIQTVADYPLNLYFHAPESQPSESHAPEAHALDSTGQGSAPSKSAGLYVMQYTPSRLAFTHRGTPIQLTQHTLYPAEDTTTLTLQPAHPVDFTLYLRIPGWLTRPATLTLNGHTLKAPAAGTFAVLRRTWHPGDTLTLTLPQDFRTEAIDDRNPNTVALMRGPVQYVALNPAPGLSADPLTLPASLKQITPQAFTENYAGQQIVFVPLYQVRNDTYTSYFTRA